MEKLKNNCIGRHVPVQYFSSIIGRFGLYLQKLATGDISTDYIEKVGNLISQDSRSVYAHMLEFSNQEKVICRNVKSPYTDRNNLFIGIALVVAFVLSAVAIIFGIIALSSVSLLNIPNLVAILSLSSGGSVLIVTCIALIVLRLRSVSQNKKMLNRCKEYWEARSKQIEQMERILQNIQPYAILPES